jgi:hypothetical protein
MPERDRTAVSQELSQLLGGSETTDLLGSVIRSDRHRAGRSVPFAEPDTMTSHTVIRQYDNETGTQSDHNTSSLASKQASPVPLRQADTTKGIRAVGTRAQPDSGNQESATGDLLARRLAEAKRIAESATTTVTLRLPRELNDWLDEYVHRAWPARVRKQELVIEGLRMLFARRGRPGEPILPTGLLPQEAQ